MECGVESDAKRQWPDERQALILSLFVLYRKPAYHECGHARWRCLVVSRVFQEVLPVACAEAYKGVFKLMRKTTRRSGVGVEIVSRYAMRQKHNRAAGGHRKRRDQRQVLCGLQHRVYEQGGWREVNLQLAVRQGSGLDIVFPTRAPFICDRMGRWTK